MNDTLDTMTLKELRSLAATHDIAGRSKMNKLALVEAIRAARDEAASPAPVAADTAEVSSASAPIVPRVAEAPPATSARPLGEAPSRADFTTSASHSSSATAKRAIERAAAIPVGGSAPAGMPELVPVHPHAGKGPLLPPLVLEVPSMDYDDAFLILLPQTPSSMVCAWSLTEAERRAFGDAPVELRIVDQSWGSRVVLRAGPGLDTRRWSVAGLTPDRTYRAFLGRLDGEHFVPLLISRPLALPPDRPRPWTESTRARWASFSATGIVPLDETPIGESSRPWWGGSLMGGAR